MSIIKQETGFISILDTSLPVGSQIVSTLSLDCVAIAKYNTDVASVVMFKDAEGKPTGSIKIDGSLQLHDSGGSPTVWAGTIDELIVKLNNEYFVQSITTTAPVGGATEAKQDVLNDQTIAKGIGYVLDLSAASIPPFSDLTNLEQTIKGQSTSYTILNRTANDTKELAQLFNDLQTDIYYGAIDATSMFFVPITFYIEDLAQIEFEDGNEGTQTYAGPYTATGDVETGALHQVAQLLQKQEQLLKKALLANPETENAISLSYSGNALINLTANADLNGKVLPAGSKGDITRIFDRSAGNIRYTFDGTTPTIDDPSATGNEAFSTIKNINFDTFRLQGTAGGSNYSIIINLYKK